MNRMQSTVPLAALQGSLRDFLAPKGPDLVGRSKVFSIGRMCGASARAVAVCAFDFHCALAWRHGVV